MKVIVLLSLLGVLAGCGTSEPDEPLQVIGCPLECQADVGLADMGALADTAVDEPDTSLEDAQSAPDVDERPTLEASGANEADILYGWVAAGQPSEARVEEVVATGAVIISLRDQSEDPFDEPALVDSLGGTFIRYATQSSDYDDPAFREAMYDLYDEQLDAGNIVYLHCASSNRVGASWALYQAERKGVEAEAALQMGRDAGLTSLESRVREVLGL